MSQCGAEVMYAKGKADVYPMTYYCMRERGHDGPHVVEVPNPKDFETEDE